MSTGNVDFEKFTSLPHANYLIFIMLVSQRDLPVPEGLRLIEQADYNSAEDAFPRIVFLLPC
jgi:hypothetical protein